MALEALTPSRRRRARLALQTIGRLGGLSTSDGKRAAAQRNVALAREAASSPAKRAIFTSEEAENGVYRRDSAQIPGESETEAVQFPKIIGHRKAECKIYGKKPDYPFYRVAS
jgi:hypothetical protein